MDKHKGSHLLAKLCLWGSSKGKYINVNSGQINAAGSYGPKINHSLAQSVQITSPEEGFWKADNGS